MERLQHRPGRRPDRPVVRARSASTFRRRWTTSGPGSASQRPKLHQPERPQWKRPPKPKCAAAGAGGPRDYLLEDRNLPADVLAAYRIGEDDQRRDRLPVPACPTARWRWSSGATRSTAPSRCRPTATASRSCSAGRRSRRTRAPSSSPRARSTRCRWAAYGYPALSVPFGGGGGGKQKWIENEFDRLERFERIYLALDMDEPGDEAAVEIASRLGHHRCLRVKMPRKDGNECLVEGVPQAAMDAAIANATWFEVPGLRLPSDFADKVIALFWPREGEHVGYRTPYGKLGDKLLFRPGELTIWTGDSRRRQDADPVRLRRRLDQAGRPHLPVEPRNAPGLHAEAHVQADHRHRPADRGRDPARARMGELRACCSTSSPASRSSRSC